MSDPSCGDYCMAGQCAVTSERDGRGLQWIISLLPSAITDALGMGGNNDSENDSEGSDDNSNGSNNESDGSDDESDEFVDEGDESDEVEEEEETEEEEESDESDAECLVIDGCLAECLAIDGCQAYLEEEESDAECYPAFEKSFTQEFFKTTQDCQYKPMKKTKKNQNF